MKNAMLIFFYCFLIASFSGFKNPSDMELNWSPYRAYPCYEKIEYSTARGDYNSTRQQYMWYVKFKSSYRDYVSFSYAGTENHIIEVNCNSRTKLKPSGESQSPYDWFLVAEPAFISVWIDKVRVGFNDTGEYSSCYSNN